MVVFFIFSLRATKHFLFLDHPTIFIIDNLVNLFLEYNDTLIWSSYHCRNAFLHFYIYQFTSSMGEFNLRFSLQKSAS